MRVNKAAMFGLDARIALAIFGALSVISGAALYSAIQEAKTTALLTELNEFGKAWEQYYLDTGQDLPPTDSDSANPAFYVLQTSPLISDSVTGWQGPYVSYEAVGTEADHPIYGTFNIMKLTTDVDWTHWGGGTCTTGRTCFYWIYLDSFDSDTLAKSIDAKIDNSDGANTGNFRWYGPDGSDTYRYALKYAPVKNPHD